MWLPSRQLCRQAIRPAPFPFPFVFSITGSLTPVSDVWKTRDGSIILMMMRPTVRMRRKGLMVTQYYSQSSEGYFSLWENLGCDHQQQHEHFHCPMATLLLRPSFNLSNVRNEIERCKGPPTARPPIAG